LVEEYGLQHLIDRATIAFFTCVATFMPPQVTNADRVIAASPEIEEKTPAVSMEDAKKAVIAQMEKIQATIRFPQIVKSKQSKISDHEQAVLKVFTINLVLKSHSWFASSYAALSDPLPL
jgi:hypothetical protein